MEDRALEAAWRAVADAAGGAIARVTAVIDARAAGEATLADWSGPHRASFDAQSPAAQAELAWLIDAIQAAREAARAAVVEVEVARTYVDGA